MSVPVSVAKPGQFPPDFGWEVAIAGRSNAGKSSVINALLGRKGMARTSRTPGRTRLYNYFELRPVSGWWTCPDMAMPRSTPKPGKAGDPWATP